MANVSYEATATIRASVEQVYSYLADFPRHVEWNYQPQEMVALTEGPVRVGARYKTEEKNFPSQMPTMQKAIMSIIVPIMKKIYGAGSYTIAEITALEPNKRIAWTAHAPNKKGETLMQMHWEIRLQPANGSTQLTQHCEIDPPTGSPLAKMANEDMAKMGRAEAITNLGRLKSLLEGHQKQAVLQVAS